MEPAAGGTEPPTTKPTGVLAGPTIPQLDLRGSLYDFLATSSASKSSRRPKTQRAAVDGNETQPASTTAAGGEASSSSSPSAQPSPLLPTDGAAKPKPKMIGSRSRSEGAMPRPAVHNHGYLVVKEGGIVVRVASEPGAEEDDGSKEGGGDTTSSSPSSSSSSNRVRPKPLVHALTTTDLERLRRTAASNYVDVATQRGTSPAHSPSPPSSEASSPTSSTPSSAASSPRKPRRTSSPRQRRPQHQRPPPLIPGSSYSSFISGEVTLEASLYSTTPRGFRPPSSANIFSTETEDEAADSPPPKTATTRPTRLERTGSHYPEEADLVIFGPSGQMPAIPTTTKELRWAFGPEGSAPTEMAAYGHRGLTEEEEGRNSKDDSSSDEFTTSSDEDVLEPLSDYDEEQELANVEEEWDTSEEEEQERHMRTIDRGPNLAEHTQEGSVWNQRFQELVRLQEEDETKYQQLAYLAHDFQHAAEVYGRIIISERYLPVEQKTIKPLDIGGIAGGEKFIVQGILFKYALDTELVPGIWMYGGDFPDDSAAMKAAGHELRSLARIEDSAHARTEGLMLPLETVVDYRGFRLLAVSVLPISRQTIVYGSHDGGRSVHATYPLFNRKFKAVFAGLNLKGHRVRNRLLFGPGDIEGHWGADGQLYLLDFSRVYPPEDILHVRHYFPAVSSRGLFYRMLRPELVYSNPVPLCSDAYSRWIAEDKNAHVHNLEVSDATRVLIEKVIPDLTLELTFRCIKLNPNEFALGDLGISVQVLHQHVHHILHRMHTCGINMRYLGLLRSKFIDTARNYLVEGSGMDPTTASHNSVGIVYSSIIFTEMAARVAKNIIRALLREKMKQLKVPSSEPYRQLVLLLFNLFSGQHQLSSKFWTATKLPRVSSPLVAKRQNKDSGTQIYADEDRGLEYYIYQQNLRRKNNPKPKKRLSCFRTINDRSTLKSSIAGELKRMKSQEDEELRSSGEASEGDGENGEDEEMSKPFPKPGKSYIWGHNDEDDLLSDLLPMKLAIRAKFGQLALTPQEWESRSRDRPLLFQGLFFHRLCEMLGIVMSNQPMIFQELNVTTSTTITPTKFEFLDPHLLDLSVKVKHMHLIASCEGMALFMKSARLIEEKICLTDEERKKCTLLLTFAQQKFEFALKSITDSVHTLLHLAKVVYFLGSYFSNTGTGGRDQLRSSNGTRRKDEDMVNSKRVLLEAALKYYEQAINILKKRDSMATMLAKRKATSKNSPPGSLGTMKSDGKGSSGNLGRVLSHREKKERRHKKQIDVNQDLLCRAALEMLAVLCELSMLYKTSQALSDPSVPRDRRRIWGSAWDLLQEMLMKYPLKFRSAYQAHITALMRGYGSVFASKRNECPIFSYIKMDRLGVVVASVMELQSLRIIHERLVQAYYVDKKERNKLELEELEKARKAAEEEQQRRKTERREELKQLAALSPLRKSLDAAHHTKMKESELASGRTALTISISDETVRDHALKGTTASSVKEELLRSRDDTQISVRHSGKKDQEYALAVSPADKKNRRKSMVEPAQLSSLIRDPSASTLKKSEEKKLSSSKSIKDEKPSKKKKKSKKSKKNEEGKGSKKKKKKKERDASDHASSQSVQASSKPDDLDGSTAFFLHLASGASRGALVPTAKTQQATQGTNENGEAPATKSDSSSGSSESESDSNAISTEVRGGGRIGILKTLQKRRTENLDAKKRRQDTPQRRVTDLGENKGDGGGSVSSIPISRSFDVEKDVQEFLRSSGPSVPSAGSAKAALRSQGLPSRFERGPSFATAFRERARRRFMENEGFPFLISTFDSVFYDPVPSRSSSADAATMAQEREADRLEWERHRNIKKKHRRGAEKYQGEDILISWGGRYLAAKLDGTVYLSPIITRDTVWWVESCLLKANGPEGEETFNVHLRSAHGKYLTLTDPQKGTVAAWAARLTDQARWEWSVVSSPDSPEAMLLRAPTTEKILCPPSRRGVTITAGKESVSVSKGEYWSVKLANVNRVHLRTAAHGKYLRARSVDSVNTSEPKRNQITASAFVPSYVHDSWWMELHPIDPQKAALRSSDGSYLGPLWVYERKGAQPLQNVEIRTSSDPFFFTMVPLDYYKKEDERRQAREERAQAGEAREPGPGGEDDLTEREIDIELTVALYAERDKGDKGSGGFLSANERGQVYLSASPALHAHLGPHLQLSSSSSTSSLSLSSSSTAPSSSSAPGEEELKLEEAVWVLRWYNPKWPTILTNLYAELELCCDSLFTPSSSSASASSASSTRESSLASSGSPAPSSSLSPNPGRSPAAMHASTHVEGIGSLENLEPENSPFLSTQLQAVLQRMVDRARFHVHV